MSYSFDGTNDRLAGSFASSYSGYPITLACWRKVSDTTGTTRAFLRVGASSSADDGIHGIRSGNGVADQYQGMTTADSGGTTQANVVATIDDTWFGIVYVATSETNRDLYVQTIGQTDGVTTSRAVSTIQHIAVGETFAAGADLNGLLAECACWNVALNSTQITSYLAGDAASGIAAANLIGYWPLSASNSTQSNLGVDTGGDLTVTGATFDSDHPTIGGGGSSTTVTPNVAGMGV